MGYRHQMISDTMIPNKSLPEWFTEKWKGVSFDSVDYMASHTEVKMYGYWIGFITDVQKVVIEKKLSSVQLVFFADEGLSMYGRPDIIHYEITEDEIFESHADWTKEKWDAEDRKIDKEGY